MSNTTDLIPNCGNCRFSVMVTHDQGTCNRYAPKPSHATQGEVWAEWPLVMPHDWCGEWALPVDDIAVLPNFSIPEPATRFPNFSSYDEPYSDPLR